MKGEAPVWSPTDKPEEVSEKARSADAPAPAAAPAAPGGGVVTSCPVPGCSSKATNVERHIYDRAKAGDDAHIKWRLDHPKKPGPAKSASASPAPAADPAAVHPTNAAAGRVVTLGLLGVAGRYYSDLKLPSSPLDTSPGSVWMGEFSEANQALLEELFPEGLQEHGAKIAWASCVGQFFMVNGKPDGGKKQPGSNGADNRSKGQGENISSEVPNA